MRDINLTPVDFFGSTVDDFFLTSESEIGRNENLSKSESKFSETTFMLRRSLRSVILQALPIFCPHLQ